MSDPTHARIAQLIEDHPVMLFMKGDRGRPQCGFSAQVIQILDSLIPDYQTFDVLSDPEVRNGIKEFSSWPTIPQLYVKGEFVGGCDIVKELYATGDLQKTLGVDATTASPPSVTITDAAAAALRQLADERPGQVLHLAVDARFQNSLYFGPEEPAALRVSSNGVELVVDPVSAGRIDGASIDAAQTDQGVGFAIQNPNAPTSVQQLTAQELAAWRNEGRAFELLDVRTADERERARIEGARLLDAATAREIEQRPRDTVLVFHCHHGGRSQAAAEHFAALGFEQVYNVVGGIDAWSVEVDPSVPRY